MKRLIAILMATMTFGVLAATETIDGIRWSYTVSDGEASVGYYSRETIYGGITVPAYIAGYPVTRIEDRAFDECRSITSVTIPNGVTSIGDEAFSYCSRLMSVMIPNSVTNIGDEAFFCCSGLQIVEIGDGVSSIGRNTFYGCRELNNVTIGNGVTSIGDQAFSGCSVLRSVTIPDSVTSIGNSAFSGCSALTSVTIPGSVTSIGNYTFHECTNLTSVTIGNGVTGIGNSAFSGCSALTSVTIPGSVTGFGNYTFYECTNLTSVTIPDSVTSIGDYAFYGCTGLTSVTIPDSVTSIGDRAFYGCTGLTSVTIPDSVTGIGNSAFSGCSALTSVTIPDSVTSIGSCAFDGCYNIREVVVPGWRCGIPFANVTNLVISSGTADVKNSAFYGCSGLTSVTIPNSVTNIGAWAFENCSGLTSVTIPDSVTSVGSSAFSGCNELASVTIGDGVTSIGTSAFRGCSGLTSVTIPDSVTSIESYAFYGCYNLAEVSDLSLNVQIGDSAFACCPMLADANGFVILNGVVFGYYGDDANVVVPDCVSVGDSVFSHNEDMVSVTLPSGVRKIGNEAFRGCTGLLQSGIGPGVTAICSRAYQDCPAMSSLTLPDGIEAIEDYAFKGCTGLVSVVIGSDIRRIGKGAFEGCDSITEVVVPQFVTDAGLRTIFPDSYAKIEKVTFVGLVTEIADSAFEDCTGVYEFSSPETVTNIGRSAFAKCSSLTNAVLSSILLNVGDYAFAHCARLQTFTCPPQAETFGRGVFEGDTNLVSVLLPEKMKNVPPDLFKECQSLTTAALPSGIKSIGDRSFFNCRQLASVTMPSGVKGVGAEAFSGCTNLVSVTIPRSVETIGNNAFALCEKIEKAIVPALAVSAPLAGVFPDSWQTIQEIVIDEGADEIADNAFDGCKKLQKVVAPASITFLGENVFNKCSALMEVHFLGDAPTVGQSIYAGTPMRLATYVQEGSVGWNGTIADLLPDAWPVSTVAGEVRADARAIQHESGDLSASSVCVVTFDAKGGDVAPVSRQVMNGTAVGALPVPVKPNYSFQGWFTMPGGGNKVSENTKIVASVTYYAHWMFSGPSFVVGFNANGGFVSETSRVVEAGSIIEEFPVPTRSGYTFDGWYTLPDGGTAVAASPIAANVTYYAHWTAIPIYTITYKPGANGTGSQQTATKTNDVALTLKGAIFVRMGFTQTGWATSDSGEKAYNLNSSYASNASVTLYPFWNANKYTVTFDANGGTGGWSLSMDYGAAITAPTVSRDGYIFDSWSPTVPTTVPASDVTCVAQWTKLPDPEPDPVPTPGPEPTPTPTPNPEPTPVPTPEPTPEPEPEGEQLFADVGGAAPSAAASEYNGYLYDEESGSVKGTIQVKVGKPNKKTGLATVKATVVIGAKKVSLKGADKGKAAIEKDGPTEIELVGGEACFITLGADGLSGRYDAYRIDGSRNFFASKDKTELSAANAILSKWLGSFMVVWDGGSLSVNIAAKGKVKVSGTLADGKTKVTANTVLLIGEEWSCVSVAVPKANLAFVLWLSHDGRTIEAEGLGDDVHVGLPGTLADGAAFHVDVDEFAAVFGQAMLPYLPDGVSVTQKGAKWTLPKAGKVVYKNGALDETKLGENPCGLKLTYTAKSGTFKGSFKVYAEVKGKPKATTVNVTGFLLNGVGYGTATVKGKGSVAVSIE